MLPRDYATQDCSIARSLEVLGDRWTLLVIRCALVGITRFDDFRRHLDIADNVLADRLARLTDEGVLERLPYQDRPVRHEYRASDKGRQLWPLLVALVEWGDRHYAPHGPPRVIIHSECGGQVTQHLLCGACDAQVGAGEVSVRPGAGAGRRRATPATRNSR